MRNITPVHSQKERFTDLEKQSVATRSIKDLNQTLQKLNTMTDDNATFLKSLITWELDRRTNST